MELILGAAIGFGIACFIFWKWPAIFSGFVKDVTDKIDGASK